MIYCNLGFVVDPSRYDEFSVWALAQGAEIASACDDILSWQVMAVADVPGDPEFAKQARNVSLMLGFASLLLARQWLDASLPAILENYAGQFGEPLFFVTMLEQLK